MKYTRAKIIQILEKDTSIDHIKKLCRDNGLTLKTAIVVDKFLDKTMEEVAAEVQVDVRTVQRKINSFIEKCSH